MTVMSEVLVLGATSMVGSHFVKYGNLRCSAFGQDDPRDTGLELDRFERVDMEDLTALRQALDRVTDPVVVNFAAKTNVDRIERERPPEGAAGSGSAWTVNALAPESIAASTRASGRLFVQISTDFVFDGRAGPYDEGSPRSRWGPGMSWYGWTKSEGERRALRENPSTVVVRISYPYRAGFPAKTDFARWMVARAQEKSLPPLYSDQQITPTWVPDVTEAVVRIVRDGARGLFHVASPTPTSPFELGGELLRLAAVPDARVTPGLLSRETADPTRAPRPRLGGLGSSATARAGFHLTPWRDGVRQLARLEGWTE